MARDAATSVAAAQSHRAVSAAHAAAVSVSPSVVVVVVVAAAGAASVREMKARASHPPVAPRRRARLGGVRELSQIARDVVVAVLARVIRVVLFFPDVVVVRAKNERVVAQRADDFRRVRRLVDPAALPVLELLVRVAFHLSHAVRHRVHRAHLAVRHERRHRHRALAVPVRALLRDLRVEFLRLRRELSLPRLLRALLLHQARDGARPACARGRRRSRALLDGARALPRRGRGRASRPRDREPRLLRGGRCRGEEPERLVVHVRRRARLRRRRQRARKMYRLRSDRRDRRRRFLRGRLLRRLRDLLRSLGRRRGVHGRVVVRLGQLPERHGGARDLSDEASRRIRSISIFSKWTILSCARQSSSKRALVLVNADASRRRSLSLQPELPHQRRRTLRKRQNLVLDRELLPPRRRRRAAARRRRRLLLRRVLQPHRPVPQLEHPGADRHRNAHDDALAHAVDSVHAAAQRGVEQMVRGLLERREHQDAVLHLRHAESRDAEHLALVGHDVGEEHRMPRVDGHPVGFHRVVDLFDDAKPRGFDA
eukprot:29101-Pelagococcus_subviridis.AAC.6